MAFMFEREDPAACFVEADAGLDWDVDMMAVMRDVSVVWSGL